MTKRIGGVVAAGGARAFRGGDDRFERLPLGGRPAARRGVERGVDVAILRIRRGTVRFGFREIADDRPGAACGDARRLLVVADERRDVVPGAHERVEHCAANVAGRASQEDPHLGALQLTSGRRKRGYGPRVRVKGDTIVANAGQTLGPGQVLTWKQAGPRKTALT